MFYDAASGLRAVRASRVAAWIGFGCALLGAVLGPDRVRAEDLIVNYDQSQLLRLPRSAVELIVGNPSIADVTIQDGRLLVITGKSFGITNLIALDAQRVVIEEHRILVTRDERKIVNLFKGGRRETYNCIAQCNPSITVGDDGPYFEVITKQSERKAKLSEGQTDPTPGGPQ